MSRIVAIDSEGNEHYPFSDWDHEPCACFNKFGNCGNLALNCCGDKCKDPTDITCAGYSSSLKTYTLDEEVPPVTVRLKDVGERVEYKGGSYVCTAKIEDSGERTEFSTGAVRDMHAGKGRMDLLPWHAIMEVSKHCENGAVKYGEHNVDKGIPVHSLMDSGMRHAAKHMAGYSDEPHLLAACWNFLWALEMTITHPELNDIPWEEKDDS